MRFAVDRLDHLVITCRDVEISASWYQRVLGMEREEFGPHRRTSLRFGGQKINLRPVSATQEEWFTGAAGGVPDVIPEVSLSGAPLGIGALLKQAGLAPSTTEALRLVDQGGVRVDGSAVSDRALKLSLGTYVVQVGKRKFARVTLT